MLRRTLIAGFISVIAAAGLFAAYQSLALRRAAEQIRTAEELTGARRELPERTATDTPSAQDKEYDPELSPVDTVSAMPLYAEIYAKNTFAYGKSRFTRNRYRTSDADDPVSELVRSGFAPDSQTRIFMEGAMGDRVKLKIDYNSDRPEEENSYYINYRAKEDDEVVRDVSIGDIDLKFGNSRFVNFDNRSRKALGFSTQLARGPLRVQGFATVTKGRFATDRFRGGGSHTSIVLRDFQFVRGRYYQLEPFRRYDNLNAPPVITSPADDYITFHSRPADPASYRPYPVNIMPGSVSIYRDDQTDGNNQSAVVLSLDGGYYDKLTEGTDYAVNYSTGLITFLTAIDEKARIYAVYTPGGISTDPAARSDIYPGRTFVFLRYGALSDEYALGYDANHDGRVNYDIYEVRGFYALAASGIDPEGITTVITGQDGPLAGAERTSVGGYTISHETGTMRFHLREPFRYLSGADAAIIYSPVALTDAYLVSNYAIEAEFSARAASWQLSHQNIIEKSLTVTVNGSLVDESLYTVNALSGIIEFEENYLIPESAEVVISYQYASELEHDAQFAGGGRAEYDITRFLTLGSSALYLRDADAYRAPDPGDEPASVLSAEADMRLKASRADITNLLKTLTRGRITHQPFHADAYAEYARSRRESNTYGIALVDDFDSAFTAAMVSLSEKEWILASPPDAESQSGRGRLLYHYYRSLSSYTLQGESFAAYPVDYAVKAGPFNVRSGPHPDSDDNLSLVFDYRFSGAETYTAAVSSLGPGGSDLSAIEYVEVTYKASGADGSVALSFDLGSVPEDADGDGMLDTEDRNSNGVLDNNPYGIFEDEGITFNPAASYATVLGSGPRLNASTRGDGVLTTEDIDRNGTLDNTASFVSFPGAYALVNKAPGNLVVAPTDSTWKTARIYLDRTLAGTAQTEILKRARHLRLVLRRQGATQGRVFISSIRLVSTSWAPQDNRLTVSFISRYNDAAYASDYFALSNRSVAQKIYGSGSGSDDVSEMEEFALRLAYDSLATTDAAILRKFPRGFDSSYYRALALWINPQSYSAGDVITISVGSGEKDTLNFTVPLQGSSWQKLKLNFHSPNSVTGYPDLRRLSFLRLTVTGAASGELWLNNCYMEEPITATGEAWCAEASIGSDMPVIRTAGGSYLDRLRLAYSHETVGASFESQVRTRTARRQDSVSFSSQLTDRVSADMNYTAIRTASDPNDTSVPLLERGDASRREWSSAVRYASDGDSLLLRYQGEERESAVPWIISAGRYTRRQSAATHAPLVSLTTVAKDTPAGTMTLSTTMESIFRSKQEGVADAPAQDFAIRNEESQFESLTVLLEQQGRWLVTRTRVSSSLDAVVTADIDPAGDETIVREVDGGFRVPFFESTADTRYSSRARGVSFMYSPRPAPFFAPSHEISFTHSENGFRDYSEEERTRYRRFSRARDASTEASSVISLPLALNLFLFDSVQLNHRRTAVLTETGAPFEREHGSIGGGFDDRYGINRSFGGCMPLVTDYYQRPPWEYYAGGGNARGGREAVRRTLNRDIMENGLPVSDYENTLSLRDAADLRLLLSEGLFRGSCDVSLWQVSSRENTEGIPQQTVNTSLTMDGSFDIASLLPFKFPAPVHTVVGARTELSLNPTYSYTRNMLITQNILEESHAPALEITVGWNDRQLILSGGMDFRHRRNRGYITEKDGVYYDNLPSYAVDSRDRGWRFSAEYRTGILPLYDLLAKEYLLFSYPEFRIRYDYLSRAYDYRYEASPEPYTSHLLTLALDLNVHEYVQGELYTKAALERWEARDSRRVIREIISYEAGFSLILKY